MSLRCVIIGGCTGTPCPKWLSSQDISPGAGRGQAGEGACPAQLRSSGMRAALLFPALAAVVDSVSPAGLTTTDNISPGPPAGLTPTLGWNSWNFYRGLLSEDVVKETASALVSTGLAEKGFTSVNMDDLWAGGRSNTTGELFPIASKFPSGIPALVEQPSLAPSQVRLRHAIAA